MSLAWPLHVFAATTLDWQYASLAIGATAFLIAWASRQVWWWRLIHLVFAPLAWSVAQAGVDPVFFLLGFMLLLLVCRGALTGQVPLYLSGSTAVDALARLIEERQVRHFIDLGSGIGSTVAPLAHQFPSVRFTGVENSAIPWLVGWLRTRGLDNCDWRWGDLWTAELRPFDLAYAFLSPVPMPRLGARVASEMRPGTLFVSNAFEIPDRQPDFIDDSGEFPLYGYIGGALPPAATA